MLNNSLILLFLHPHAFKIVETDAFDIGYGGILKQVAKDDAKEQIVRFHSGSWTTT